MQSNLKLLNSELASFHHSCLFFLTRRLVALLSYKLMHFVSLTRESVFLKTQNPLTKLKVTLIKRALLGELVFSNHCSKKS